MLGSLTNSLFADGCEVYKLADQSYALSIFKNGSSALKWAGSQLVDHAEVKTIPVIDVFYREPVDRMVSGIGKYLLDLMMSDINLDIKTANVFATTYLSLNKHYCPQFFWVLNFCRYSDALIRVRPLTDLSQYLPMSGGPPKLSFPEIKERLMANPELPAYLGYDYALGDFMNQTVPLSDIVSRIKSHYPTTYDLINRTNRIVSLCNLPN
jgi:hypothetical protein